MSTQTDQDPLADVHLLTRELQEVGATTQVGSNREETSFDLRGKNIPNVSRKLKRKKRRVETETHL